MRLSLGGRIKRCTLYVCPSVCPVPFVYLKSESRRNVKFGGAITMDTCNGVTAWRRIFEIKGSKIKVTRKEYVKKLVYVCVCS